MNIADGFFSLFKTVFLFFYHFAHASCKQTSKFNDFRPNTRCLEHLRLRRRLDIPRDRELTPCIQLHHVIYLTYICVTQFYNEHGTQTPGSVENIIIKLSYSCCCWCTICTGNRTKIIQDGGQRRTCCARARAY